MRYEINLNILDKDKHGSFIESLRFSLDAEDITKGVLAIENYSDLIIDIYFKFDCYDIDQLKDLFFGEINKENFKEYLKDDIKQLEIEEIESNFEKSELLKKEFGIIYTPIDLSIEKSF